MSAGGKVLDHHSCDFYPERWFDLVVCLQTDNTVLYDRLAARGYAQNKITENVTCEIMMECVQDAREFYKDELVLVLQSDSAEQQEANLQTILARIQQWSPAGGARAAGAAAVAASGGGGGYASSPHPAGAAGGGSCAAGGGGKAAASRFTPY